MGISQMKLSRNAANRIIRVGIAGFESQSRTAINLFFMQQGQQYTLVPMEQADVLIVDMEYPAVTPVLEQYRSLRPLVAVTATENTFAGAVTLKKPLEGKRLMKAIGQACKQFEPPQPAGKELPVAVSNGGEKAFQEYQKRIAAGRQAMEDYQHNSTAREQRSSMLRQRFVLEDTPQVTPEKVVKPSVPAKKQAKQQAKQQASKPVSAGKAKTVTRQAAAKVAVRSQSKADLPQERKAPEKKPQEIKARLSYQMVYECCGNAPDVNMHEPEQRRRVFFKDDSTLLAALKEAIDEAQKTQQPVEISGLPGTLAFLPGPGCFLFDFSEELLVPLALTRFGYQELNLKSRPDLDVDRPSIAGSKVTIEAWDQLLWKVALWTSKGRLNKALDPEKPCRLAAEFDFDRLLAIPHASTISSLWGRHSLSALEVVKVLKINQRYVFSFMSAANSLGVFK